MIRRHSRSGVALDTNLLLPLWIGSYQRALLTKFKRTRKYSQSYDLLAALIKPVSRLLITPHVVTEVSNLAGQLGEGLCQSFRQQVARIIPQCCEHSVASAKLVSDSLFPRLGLTDVALTELAGQNVLVLTDDLPLYLELMKQKHPVINFTHVLSDVMELT
jgi:hypothetical protein